MILLLLLVHLALLVKTQFTLWPEMVVYPYLINHGFALYKEIINPYPPGFAYFLVAFTKAFGYTPLPFKIFTWAIILAVDLLIYKVAKYLFKQDSLAQVSTAFFILLSIPFGINGLWFELIQTIPILLGLFLFLKYLEKPNKTGLFYSCLFFSSAFFIKQQAAWLFPPLAFFLIAKNKKNLGNFILGNWRLVLPFAAFFILEIFIFKMNGLYNNFLYWNLKFPLIASQLPGYIQLPTTRQILIMASALLLATFSLGKKKNLSVVFSFAASTILFTYPRFDYFHLVPFIALVSLLVPFGLKNFFSSNNFTKASIAIVLLILLAFSLKSYKFLLSNNETRFFEPELLKERNIIQHVIKPGDTVYMQNSQDQLLPLLNALPLKPWADEFPWYLEDNDLQDRIVSSFIEEKPKYIIFRKYVPGGMYSLGSYKPGKIVEYIDNNYHIASYISEDLIIKERN